MLPTWSRFSHVNGRTRFRYYHVVNSSYSFNSMKKGGPASSQRAAEWLQKQHESWPRSSQGFTTFDDDISGELKLILRKLSKRDVTTKLRGLEELRSLLENEEEAENVCIELLPVWGKILSRLMIDLDVRVRETLHQCHAILVKRLGKQMAPHIRSILPSWIRSFFIPLRKNSPQPADCFEKLFPPQKRADIISFAEREMMDTIYECLFEHGIDEVSRPDIYVHQEEREWRYGYYVASAVHMVIYMMEITGSETLLVKCRERFMRDARFWDLGISKISEIRRSFYLLMNAILRFDETILKQIDVLSHIIEGILIKAWSMEIDPKNIETLLICTQKLIDLDHDHINKSNRNHFFRNIVRFLQDGCRTSGRVSYGIMSDLCLVLSRWESRSIEELTSAWWKGLESLSVIDRSTLQIGLNYYVKLLVQLAKTGKEIDSDFWFVTKTRLRDLFYLYAGLQVSKFPMMIG